MSRRVNIKVELHLTLDMEEGIEVGAVIDDLVFEPTQGNGDLVYDVLDCLVGDQEILDSR